MATYDNQYRPVSTYETGNNDPLSIRSVRHKSESVNNYVKHVASQFEFRSWACIPVVQSKDTDANENVTALFASLYVPPIYNYIYYWVNHKVTTVSGSDEVTWRIYLTNGLYKGTFILDADKIPKPYNSATIISSLSGWDVDDGNIAIPRRTNKIYCIITSENDTITVRGTISTVNMVAYMG